MNEELEHIVRERTIQVEDLHNQMEKAREMSNEKANDVLHNVKNVLNSLIIGTSMMGDILSKSKVNRVQMVAQLLQENQSKLGTFLTEGEKGRLLPDFLMALSSHLGREREMIVEELDGLTRNLEHIKVSIQLQLKSARLGHAGEIFNLRETVEEALDINRDALERLPIQVKREFHATPDISFNKHEVLQILVNLISNAINAMEEYQPETMLLTLRLYANEQFVCCEVHDSGIGISSENLDKLFAYGFTTRKTGHGFGLHSCMALATEMKGKLHADSDGPGKGALFTLSLPFKS
jgi:signal transduction histidine kinase